jgi:hypothetical protein
MLKAIRKSLFNTTVVMTPFLLSACGEDPNTPQKFEILLLPALFFTVSLAHNWLKSRSPSNPHAAA